MTETEIETTSSVSLDDIGHPKGTLAVLALYMLLFILGWAALYFGAFLPRGAPDLAPDQAHSSHQHPADHQGGAP